MLSTLERTSLITTKLPTDIVAPENVWHFKLLILEKQHLRITNL